MNHGNESRLGAVTLLAVSMLCAQTPDTAALRGQVTDESGAIVSGALITVRNSGTGFRRQAISDETGRYAIANLPLTPPYEVTAEKQGFAAGRLRDVKLRPGETATADFTLAPEAGFSSVQVFGTATGVNTDSPQTGDRLPQEKIENTPVLGRKLTSLPLLDSSVRPARGTGDLFLGSTLFVVSASGRRQTSYTIDGGTANDAWGRQSIFTSLPLSALEEVTVLTNPFSAEYGYSSGAAINVNTRSGTDVFHGEGNVLARPPGIQARNPLAAANTNDRLNQFSGALGGPVIAQRTYFLVAGEYDRQHRDATLTSPLMPGAAYTGEVRQSLLLGRLDHRVNAASTVGLRLASDLLSDTNPNDAVGGLALPSTARVFRRATYSAQLIATSILTPALVNEARAEFLVGSPITQFTPVNPSTQFVSAGVATQGDSRIANLQNHQWQMADVLSIAHGAHMLRAGVEAIHSTSGGVGQEFGSGYLLGQFTLKPGTNKPLKALTPADVQSFQQSFGNASYRVGEWMGSVFAQDNWRLRPHLTLNLGLRYDDSTFADDRNDLQPRIGFTYNPRGDQRTLIRGSYGLYYSQLRANLAASYVENGPQGIFTFSAAPGQFGFPANLAPLPAFPAGAVLPPRDIQIRPGERAYLSRFFDVGKLRGYPDRLLNPRTELFTFGLERELAARWFLTIDYTHQFTSRIDRPLDLNAPPPFVRTAPGQVRSRAEADALRPLVPVPNGYRRVIATVNDGISKYDGLTANLNRRLSRNFSMLFSYTYSHAINTVEPDVPAQDPNDANLLGRSERATSLLDQRHRAAISGWWTFERHWSVGTVTSLASGRPYNITTGADNNGDGSTADRPVINGVVIGRNAGRGTPVYDVGGFLQFETGLTTERVKLAIRGESFNALNHPNIVGRNGAYGNLASGLPQPGFAAPLGGISNVDPGREFQLMLRVQF